MDGRTIGDRGEALVAQYLLNRGWRVLERNWRCPEGEIDLVCLDRDGTAVVCEVKTRTGTAYGQPLEAITHQKAARLRRLAAVWARTQEAPLPGLRVDAIGVLLHPDDSASINHVRSI